jgi:hypothetical protein
MVHKPAGIVPTKELPATTKVCIAVILASEVGKEPPNLLVDK